jgi:hypothetical protein
VAVGEPRQHEIGNIRALAPQQSRIFLALHGLAHAELSHGITSLNALSGI